VIAARWRDKIDHVMRTVVRATALRISMLKINVVVIAIRRVKTRGNRKQAAIYAARTTRTIPRHSRHVSNSSDGYIRSAMIYALAYQAVVTLFVTRVCREENAIMSRSRSQSAPAAVMPRRVVTEKAHTRVRRFVVTRHG